MENPPVKVTKLEKKPDGSLGPTANLGQAETADQLATQLNADLALQAVASCAKSFFLLEWEGGKVPRDAEINGKKVAWTQHGLVTDTEGKTIGTYERLAEFGGKSGNMQKMLVFAS